MEIPNHVESSVENDKSEAASDTENDRENNRLFGNNGYQGPLMENAEGGNDTEKNSANQFVAANGSHRLIVLILLLFFWSFGDGIDQTKWLTV